jgi:hypothetical protein
MPLIGALPAFELGARLVVRRGAAASSLLAAAPRRPTPPLFGDGGGGSIGSVSGSSSSSSSGGDGNEGFGDLSLSGGSLRGGSLSGSGGADARLLSFRPSDGVYTLELMAWRLSGGRPVLIHVMLDQLLCAANTHALRDPFKATPLPQAPLQGQGQAPPASVSQFRAQARRAQNANAQTVRSELDNSAAGAESHRPASSAHSGGANIWLSRPAPRFGFLTGHEEPPTSPHGLTRRLTSGLRSLGLAASGRALSPPPGSHAEYFPV